MRVYVCKVHVPELCIMYLGARFKMTMDMWLCIFVVNREKEQIRWEIVQ